MVAPILLGILGAGLASQAAVHGWAIPEFRRRQGARAQGILDDLPEDASVDDKREALMGGGLLDPSRFAEIGFEDQSSTRDFFEQMRLNAANNDAAMARTMAGISANERSNALNIASNLASGGAFGIGQPAMASPQDRAPYSTGTALDYAKQSIGAIESNNNYGAIGPVVQGGQYSGEQALGKYQVMPGNLKVWSQEVFGREVGADEFLNSPDLQEQLFDAKFGELMQKHGFADAASIWHSGRDLRTAANDGATDGYTRTVDYVSRAVNGYQGIAQADQSNAARYTPELRQLASDTDNVVKVGNDIINYVTSAGPGRRLEPSVMEGYRTQAELTLIPAMQQLVDSGALQPGELEQFKEWIGDPLRISLTNSQIEKFRATITAIQSQAARTLAANGVDPRLVMQGEISQRTLTANDLPNDVQETTLPPRDRPTWDEMNVQP